VIPYTEALEAKVTRVSKFASWLRMVAGLALDPCERRHISTLDTFVDVRVRPVNVLAQDHAPEALDTRLLCGYRLLICPTVPSCFCPCPPQIPFVQAFLGLHMFWLQQLLSFPFSNSLPGEVCI
jgi:hypothetical protein